MGHTQLFESFVGFQSEPTIALLQEAMEDGRLTSSHLVRMYLDRIAKYNHEGARLNAVLEVNPDALHIAEALDIERKQKGPRGPLHGIPVLIKDNIDTGDKMHTSAGSLALANSFAAKDSFVAAQLRRAGAVLLGKTNLTEWANFMTENMPNGFSSRGGQVLNPYSPGKFDVGGSSSGTGSAISANLAVVGIGTETSGSIISPASQNSLVGIKPTVGLVSRTGIIPIANSQDTAGPMTRTVADAAALLGALTGVDDEDPATWASAGRSLTDYTQFLQADGLKGARIGIPRKVYYEGLDEERGGIVNNAIERLKRLGAEIVDPVQIDHAEQLWNHHVLLHEFKSGLNAYLSRLGPQVPVHSLADVIAFNKQHAAQALKHGQTILLESDACSGTLTEAEYIDSRLKDLYYSQTAGIDAVMAEQRLDALLFVNNWGAGIAAKAGYPSVTIPAGYTGEGEPVGVTFTAQAYSEPALIRFAYAFEQGTHYRRPPSL